MNCKICGYNLKEGQIICPNCGDIVDSGEDFNIRQQVNISSNRAVAEKKAEKTMVFKTVPEAQKKNPAQYAPAYKKAPKKSPNKSSNTKVIVLSVALAVMVLVCAVLALKIAGVLPFEETTTVTESTKETTTSPYDLQFKYEIVGDQITITEYIGLESSVIIPNEIGGKKVTKIAEKAFYESTSLQTLTIQSSVLEIGEYAFAKCSQLSLVTLSDNLRTIGSQAFYDCSSLTYIVIPSSVTSFGKFVFGNCNNLVIECSVSSEAYNYCRDNMYTYKLRIGEVETTTKEKTTNYVPDENITAKNSDFIVEEYEDGLIVRSYVGKAVNITIPSQIDGKKIIAIADYAFSNSSIKSIVLPEGIKTIGKSAFAYCSDLTSAEFNTADAVINEDAFLNCNTELIFKVIKDSTAQTYAETYLIKYTIK